MSYDLMVFEPRGELRDPKKFLAWYDRLEEVEDECDPYDFSNACASLATWLGENTKVFVPMNGPGAPDLESEEPDHLADYSVLSDGIYICYSWSDAELAYHETKRTAGLAQVGFFDVSGDSAVWFPDGDGGLTHVFDLEEPDEER